MPELVIVDYGLGNLGSVANMFRRVGTRATISSEVETIARADALVLPGVGHFDAGMQSLRARGLVDVLSRRVMDDHVPVLGICLGLQLMARSSEEGSEPGLGWIGADVRKFRASPGQRLVIPHMGWNRVTAARAPLFVGSTDAERRYYFVHSYHLVCDRETDVAAWCEHGYSFAAAIHKGNLFGTQFHPEKSHRHGMMVLQRFVEASHAA